LALSCLLEVTRRVPRRRRPGHRIAGRHAAGRKFSLLASPELASARRANLFLLEDAAFAAKTGQQPPAMPMGEAGMPNCEELLRGAMQEGLTIKACRVCCMERGLQPEEVVEGIEISSSVDLVNWVVGSDRTVFL
jgi:sulfur relay (sulfurtransferase) complex TusBCD TusD component (DsrE family)